MKIQIARERVKEKAKPLLRGGGGGHKAVGVGEGRAWEHCALIRR